MTSAPRHSEAAFETVIEYHLLGHGFVAVARDSFDRERAVFPSVVLDFIMDSQPKEWAKLEALHGPKTGEQILTDLCKSAGTGQPPNFLIANLIRLVRVVGRVAAIPWRIPGCPRF